MNQPTDYTLGQIADLLRSGTAFGGMPREEAMRIAQTMVMRHCEVGEVVFGEGQPNDGQLILVVSGEARITRRFTGETNNLIYRRAVPGHIMGEVGCIDGEVHSATCTALTEMHVAMLLREQLAELMRVTPRAASQLMAGLLRLLAQRIRHANNSLVELGQAKLALEQENQQLRADAGTRPQPLSP